MGYDVLVPDGGIVGFKGLLGDNAEEGHKHQRGEQGAAAEASMQYTFHFPAIVIE